MSKTIDEMMDEMFIDGLITDLQILERSIDRIQQSIAIVRKAETKKGGNNGDD